MMMTAALNSSFRPVDQIQDLCLDGHVERGGGLVRDQQVGVQRERHRDHGALAHPAGELVRELLRALLGTGDVHLAEHLHRLAERLFLADVLVLADGLGDLVAHLVERWSDVMGSWKIIEIFAPRMSSHLVGRQLQQVDAPEQHLSGDVRVLRVGEPHDGERADALARTGLADDAERLPRLDAVRDTVDGLHDAVVGLEVHLQVLDLQERLSHLRVPHSGIQERVDDIDDQVRCGDEQRPRMVTPITSGKSFVPIAFTAI